MQSLTSGQALIDAMADVVISLRTAACIELLERGEDHQAQMAQTPSSAAFATALAEGIALAGIQSVASSAFRRDLFSPL